MRRVGWSSAFFALLFAAPVAAQVAAPPAGARTRYAAAIAQSRAFIRDTMALIKAPGAAITVMKHGVIVWSEGFGLADVEQHVAATPHTRFRVASVSKPLTSAALGLLVEQGKIDLDAPIQRYVPTFPEKRWPITTREVAGHLAGIRHYHDGEFENQKHYGSVLEGLKIFEDDTLLFEPGTKFSYSSYGWNLVSAVIEGASGEPFLTFMTRRVFGPAGMVSTVPEFADSIIPDRAHYYVHDNTGKPTLNAPYVDNSHKWAGGGFLSTTEDLVRFGAALLGSKLLRPETVQLLWTSQTLTNGEETGYGMGWRIHQDSAGRRVVSHSGGGMGAAAHLIIYPDQQLVAALLVNSDETFISALPRIAERFLR